MSKLTNFINLFNQDEEVIDFLNGKEAKADSLESLAFLVASSFNIKKENIAIVLPSLYDSKTFVDFISQFIDPDLVLYFPCDEVLRIEAVSSSKEFLKERLYSLSKLFTSSKKHIFVLNAVSVIHELSPLEIFKNHIFEISKGEVIPPKELINKLVESGYSRVNKVEEVFQFSSRGEILDIFSPYYKDPVRIEYFDDEIDDIRLFNTKDELSFENIDKDVIIPASENIFTSNQIQEGIDKLRIDLDREVEKNKTETEELYYKVSNFISQIEVDPFNENQARYLPYFKSNHNSVLDYLLKYKVLIYRRDDVISTIENYYLEAKEYFSELYKGHLCLPREMNCFNYKEIDSFFEASSIKDEKSSLSITSIPYHFTSIGEVPSMIKGFIKEGYDVELFISKDKYARFIDVISRQNENLNLLEHFEVNIDRDLSYGFVLPSYKLIVLTQKEIFGIPDGTSYFLKRFREAKILNKYQDLSVGDYVVHEDYGIGIYKGIREYKGLEYLVLGYAGSGNPEAMVPLDKYRLIRKYSGKDGLKPSLDVLGGSSWIRRKAKIRGRIAYLADKLLEIAASRLSLPGISMEGDKDLESLFAQAFPYQLTLGQEEALQNIYSDMEKSHPMDRLLAGDVGFGKTEVAFRAAFRAIISGHQAALLCPTTVLAKQHYDVSVSRFEGFGVKIALLSRQIKPAQQEKIIKQVKEGKIDLLIGTHRILSEDIQFKDLGLLIVDEEQRFGVVHKEKIKEKYSKVDVLTLTATPIPRTLQMSLLNVRQLSLLPDPPINRLPIKTYVVRYDIKMVKEVISRELGRNGQVYYLHNRIQSIYAKAKELEKLFPSCKIGVVHGQLSSEAMNDIMEDFYEQKIDILVCTTIIETGLDVPNCNTIIVEKAENFGLAQLYQIKGRVGRSSRLAYAYLTYPDYGVLDDESRKRLKALKDFTELGSGYKIANEDLNIRGAGDILGKEQAGFIDSIGYDAYMKLLQEVMEEKNIALKGTASKPKSLRYELSFSLDSHIPSSYATESDRINIYRELFDVTTREDLEVFERKIKDVYGHFPKEVESLFLKKLIEIQLNDSAFEDFKEYIDHYLITMTSDYSLATGMGKKLSDALDKYDRRKIYPRYSGNKFIISLNKTNDYLEDLFDVCTTLLSLKD